MGEIRRRLLAELLGGERSTGELCRALGYVREDGIPRYNALDDELRRLYKKKLLYRRRGKPGERGGRPGTLWRLRRDLHAFRALWEGYPELRAEVIASPYYAKLRSLLIRAALEQAYGPNPDGTVEYYRPSEPLIRQALKHSPTFVNLVVSGRLRELVCQNLASFLENLSDLDMEMQDEFRLRYATHSILEKIVAACYTLDGCMQPLHELEERMLGMAETKGYQLALFHAWRAGILQEGALNLAQSAVYLAARRRAWPSPFFNPFKWLRYVPRERWEQIQRRMTHKVLGL